MRNRHRRFPAVVCIPALLLAACAAESPNEVATGATPARVSTTTTTAPEVAPSTTIGIDHEGTVPASEAAPLDPLTGLDLPPADVVITATPGDGLSEEATQRFLRFDLDRFAVDGSVDHIATFAAPSGAIDLFTWKSRDPNMVGIGDAPMRCFGEAAPNLTSASCGGGGDGVGDGLGHFNNGWSSDGRIITTTGSGFGADVIAVDLVTEGFRVRSLVSGGHAYFELRVNPGATVTATIYHGSGEIEDVDLQDMFGPDGPIPLEGLDAATTIAIG